MAGFEIITGVVIWVLLGMLAYKTWEVRKNSQQLVSLLEQEHQRALAAIASIAECAIESVKATSLAEREQVRAQRQVNDVQVGQMRDIIKKQANMISEAPKAPQKVRLEDGTEVPADEYDWGIGV